MLGLLVDQTGGALNGRPVRKFTSTRVPVVAIPARCRPQSVLEFPRRKTYMASTTDCTVVAVFDRADDARAAAAELKSAGFGSDKVFVSSEGAGIPGRQSEAGSAVDIGTAGSYPAQGSSTATHHEGGITGWFKSLFGADDANEHRRGYESAVAGGKTIVSVDAPESSADRVSDILNRFSPVNVHTEDYGEARGVATSNTYDSGYQGSKSDVLNARDELRGAAATTTGSAGAPVTGRNRVDTAATGTAGRQEIPVVQEELQVGKRAVQRGGVRIYSRMTETPVEENVQLREEHVRVDREPVNRPANEADFRAGREQVIEVAEYAEEPVVSKQARVVEEVSVNKEASERTETIRDTVRRSEVEVENLTGRNAQTGTTGQAYDDTDFRKDFSSRYAASGGNYDDYAPAYRYGYDIANDPRYKGQDYSQIESQLRDDYGRRYPNSTWDRVKDSVRYGWDKVTGKTRSATSR